jgi:hypothetical protein
MGTRSNIGLIEKDNTVEMVYCHWDGYPENNGKILLENYPNEAKVRHLLSFGNASSLGANIGTKHNFDNAPEDTCNFYGRDRGEKKQESVKGLSVKKALDGMQEYLYLWDTKTNSWFYSDHGGSIVPLTKADCEEKL